MIPDITTTAKEIFYGDESCRMAALIYKRFGNNLELATKKWREMLQNSTSMEDMVLLVASGKAIIQMDYLLASNDAYTRDEFELTLERLKLEYLSEIGGPPRRFYEKQ